MWHKCANCEWLLIHSDEWNEIHNICAYDDKKIGNHPFDNSCKHWAARRRINAR